MLKKTLLWIQKRWWLVLLACLGLAVLLSLLKPESLEVEVVQVQRGTLKQYLLEDGKTRLEREYTLSMPVNGKIERIDLKVGDLLTAGQQITPIRNYARQRELAGLSARLKEIQAQSRSSDLLGTQPEDFATAQARIAEGRWSLQQLRHQREMLEIEFVEQTRILERQTRLYQEGAVDLASLEQTQKQARLLQEQLQQGLAQEKASQQVLSQLELAAQKLQSTGHSQAYQRQAFQAQGEQVLAQVQIKKDELAQAMITSPVSGPVLEIMHRDAGPLAAGTPLLKVGDLASLKIEADILSEEIHQLKPGQTVEISGKALNGKVILGQVERIFPVGFTKLSALGVEQQRIKVLMRAQGVNLRPGTAVELKIITAQRENTLMIPEQALFKSEGKWQVFKLDANNQAQLQTVEVGLKNEEQAEIVKGLAPGDKVVKELNNKLKAGLKIIPLAHESTEQNQGN